MFSDHQSFEKSRPVCPARKNNQSHDFIFNPCSFSTPTYLQAFFFWIIKTKLVHFDPKSPKTTKKLIGTIENAEKSMDTPFGPISWKSHFPEGRPPGYVKIQKKEVFRENGIFMETSFFCDRYFWTGQEIYIICVYHSALCCSGSLHGFASVCASLRPGSLKYVFTIVPCVALAVCMGLHGFAPGKLKNMCLP